MLKDDFKNGILNKDFTLLAQVFEQLFSEKIEIQKEENIIINSVIKKKKTKKQLQTEEDDYIINDGLKIMEQQGNKKKTVFITSEKDPKFTRLNSSLAKTRKNKTRREAYNPIMVTCASCHASFDFKKEYPAGKMGEDNKTLCNKCHRMK